MKFQGSIKKEEEFPGVIKKKYVEFQWFQWILVFGFGISKGFITILWNFQGGAFCLEFLGVYTGKI